MKSFIEIQRILSAEPNYARKRFGAKRIGIFGSWVRSEQSADSDIDILVEFERPIGWEIVDLHDYIEERLGIKVHLVTANALKQKPRLWEIIQRDVVYA